VVVVHAGSINGTAKRWPPRYWAAFSDAVQRRTDARVVLVGAGSDEAIARRVRESAESPLISLVGCTSVEELVAVLARADLVATGDSGPLHIAVALGRPLVAVYGPTDPRIHGPFNPKGPVALHRKDLACSPCYTMANAAECPLGDPICMRLVSVDEMVGSAIRLLEHVGTEPA
jgi:lipopolysaccharide heptosyltransferase II